MAIEIKTQALHSGQRRARELVFPYKERLYICGRRWGKTTEIKEIALLVIKKGFRIALFCPQFKDISETWETISQVFRTINQAQPKGKELYSIDNQNKSVELKGFSDSASAPCFECWTLATERKKNDGRGRKYNIVIYEETQKIDTDVLEHHYTQVTKALLLDYDGTCFFFCTPPNSKQHYLYELICRGAANNPDMANNFDISQPKTKSDRIIAYRAPTTDNPFMSAEVLEGIKQSLPPLVYKQEFEAGCVDFAISPFCHVLQDTEVHRKVFKHKVIPFDKTKNVYLGFDFNKTPMAVTVSQSNDPASEWLTIKELCFDGKQVGSIYDICGIIRRYFADLGIFLQKDGVSLLPVDFNITGDATGNFSSSQRADYLTYYDIIITELGLSKKCLRVPKSNPRHSERHAQANEILMYHPKFHIATETCPRLAADLINTSCTADLGIDKKKRDPHFFDAEAYKWNIYIPRDIRPKKFF